MVAISSSSHLPHPSIEPASPALQVESLPLSHQGSPRQLKMDFHDCDWWCCWCRWYICLPLLTGVFPQSAQVMRTGTHMSGIGQHCGITAYHSAWYIKLTLKQHRTELLRCPDTQIFFPPPNALLQYFTICVWLIPQMQNHPEKDWLYIWKYIGRFHLCEDGPTNQHPSSLFKAQL